MKPSTAALYAVPLLLVLAAVDPATAADDETCTLSPADEGAIRGVMERYREGWLELDADGVMALFTEDAVLSPNGRLEAVEGRAAAREFWFPEGQEPVPLTRFTRTIRDLGGCGDFGFVRGISDVRWRQDGELMRSVSASITLLRKTADGWRITLQMWDSVE